jgi:hypothetical protein
MAAEIVVEMVGVVMTTARLAWLGKRLMVRVKLPSLLPSSLMMMPLRMTTAPSPVFQSTQRQSRRKESRANAAHHTLHAGANPLGQQAPTAVHTVANSALAAAA